MSTEKLTPLMQQYFQLKEQYSEALLFFQVGDFFELFFDQAKQAAAILGIALTKRGTHNGKPIPLCGVPVHALDHHITKLVKAGFHVAICEQLEEARPGSVVKRGVTKVLTPGTLTDEKLLDDKRSSYLCSMFVAAESVILVFGELLTGQLSATMMRVDDWRTIETQLHRYMPDEIILDGLINTKKWQAILKQMGFVLSEPVKGFVGDFPSWIAAFKGEDQSLIKKSSSLERALECFYLYLKKNQEEALAQFKQIYLYRSDDFLIVDAATQRNLELIKNNQDGSAQHTLFTVLDRAVTTMGSRMIKKWLLSPLVHKSQINHRLDAVEVMVKDIGMTQQLAELLHDIGDLERVVGRIALNRAHLYDYVHLMYALAHIPKIISLLDSFKKSALLQRAVEAIGNFTSLHKLLAAALNVDSSKNWLIKVGFDQQLDELRELLAHAHDKVVALEQQEQKRTGIGSLKIRFNQVQGYYIEITKPNLHLVPDEYKRQQSLINKERFTTLELSELEHQLAKANTEINFVEQQVYERIKQEVFAEITSLRKLAYALAHTDALIGFALTAYDHNYTRPVISDDHAIIINKGKHPVLGAMLNQEFIPNDTLLTDQEYLWIVTGPNMGGKSTYLRQIALLCLMAHCGSFIPTESAQIPVLDRIFTRVGAGDNLAEGKSTFLVEMEETATICTQATERSLVILDEVGRGTSTYDGLALAQAVVEHLYHRVKAKCLFATHYHELTKLEEELPGIVNYHAASKQRPTGVLFLHKIIKGAAEGSFGLEVARLAKLPDPLIDRARDILNELAKNGHGLYVPVQKEMVKEDENLKNKALLDQLKKIDLDNVTPREAHEFLYRIKSDLQFEK
ncbi:TPA: DNA mismatch repair protein MutS [Candidatus Dependentiae bacterium]|nr:MAG: mismatch repair protein MutS protein [candidate division TM6 bacterium GW2011_GWF2_36_131]KKQ03258.1 MAG: mismatch repair protein MutS protein [candidate division TM6 bacterium GW2011_GWE2_36_25]KKQ19849.1 MAG: mismatch repair protein MutS protein [candidate division TM6 bacterium GW2011_GWA2_36_9]HBR70314.1 DNA mismatch repair protein MutS [Candidatus Dependentiae bacterium]HCU00859.1 DNA mismatch repair protein MutS [Candidatus Dependentiae bacterium]